MPDVKPKLGAPVAGTANDPIAGVIWITIAMALFAGLAVFSRMTMNAGLHPFEVVFLRNIFACLLLAPLLVYRGPSLLRSNKFGLYGVRVVVSLLSMQAWFYAISLITIGEVTAISFLAPLFGTLGAILLLGEKVRLRRWTALGVGFLGAMVILRPTGAGLGFGEMLAVLSAMFTGRYEADVAREQLVLIDIRLPRMLLGMFVGASLAVAGAMMQACSATRWPTPV